MRDKNKKPKIRLILSFVITILIIVGIITFALFNENHKTSDLQTKQVEEKTKQGVINKVDSELEIADAKLQETSSEDIQSSNSNTNNQSNQSKSSSTSNSNSNAQANSGSTSTSRNSTNNTNNTTNTQNNTTTNQTPQRDPNSIDTSHFNYSIHHGKIDANTFAECNTKGFNRIKANPNIKNFYCVEVYTISGNVKGYYIDEQY